MKIKRDFEILLKVLKREVPDKVLVATDPKDSVYKAMIKAAQAMNSVGPWRVVWIVVDLRRRAMLAQKGRVEQSPRLAHFALLLIPKRSREYLIGDLEQEYRTIVVPEYGRFWAHVWYWEQTALALGFYVWPFLKRVLGMAAIWKLIGR